MGSTGSYTRDIAIIDGHAHPLRHREQFSPAHIVSAFTEADDRAYLDQHAGHTVTATAGIRYLAGLLGVEPTAAAMADARDRLGLVGYTRTLMTEHDLRGLLLDTGYPPSGLSLAESEKIFGVPCREVARVESLTESLFAAAKSPAELLDELGASLLALDRDRVVALKTIAAYRGGLDLRRPSQTDLQAAFDAEKQTLKHTGRIRLSQPALISAVVHIAFEAARTLGLPIQAHTGFGDSDLALSKSNPCLLAPLLESEESADVPVVLLHAAYPYVKQAGILAGLYHQVYVDISLAVPLAGHGSRRVIADLLEQAPISKVLYGSDASVGPELVSWAAAVAKRETDAVLHQLVADDWLTADQATKWAVRLFSGNAKALYRLDDWM